MGIARDLRRESWSQSARWVIRPSLWLVKENQVFLLTLPDWLRTDTLLGEHGIQGDAPTGRLEFDRRLEERRLEEADEEKLAAFRSAWCLGSESFRKECLEQMEGRLGDFN